MCGYVHRGASEPDYCPVCGAVARDFEPYTEPLQAEAGPVGQWRCLNCSYVHAASQQPELCPVCGARPDRFEPMESPELPAREGESIRLVVVGGGIAGVSAAETARKTAPAAAVTLICEEPGPPYYRLNLTRYLAGEIDRDALPIHADEWYAENRIDLRKEVPVETVSSEGNSLLLVSGEEVEFDRLIMAMGSHAFVPPIQGADLDGVVALRTKADADSIVERLGRKNRCVVVGGGILGIETAGALAQQGAEVILVESHEWLMPRQLNRRSAERLESYLGELGVRLYKQARTSLIEGTAGAEALLLSSGERIETPLVVLATGVRPNTYLARKTGLAVDKGIVVNNHLETSVPGIYAAGDVAEHNGRLYGAWGPSQYQGSIAALNALGVPTVFGGVPRSNALKVLGIDLLSIGTFEPPDGSYLALDHSSGDSFGHFVFHDGRMVGCIALNLPELGPSLKKAIESGRDFSGLLGGGATGADVIAHVEPGKDDTEEEGRREMATLDNLQDAFAGESQANRRYLAFAKKAETDGYPQVAKLFRAAAEAETVHAHAHLRVMGGIQDTTENLRAAIDGEGHEFKEMYPGFLAEAESEENQAATISFRNALAVEEIHHGLYSEALAAVEGGDDLPGAAIMVCPVCGNTVNDEAPEKCPICGVPGEKFIEIE